MERAWKILKTDKPLYGRLNDYRSVFKKVKLLVSNNAVLENSLTGIQL